MDSKTFDAVTRRFGGSATRRFAVRGLLTGAVALVGGATVLEADARKHKQGKGNGKKVTICHQGQTISVAKPALKGHLKHGDTMGACPGQDTPGAETPGPTAICTDGIKNGNETDVDCGGGTCPRCATGKTCSTRNDCASARCNAGTCQTCQNANTDCGTDANGGMCACRDHESGQRFCTKINGRLLGVGTPCSACTNGEQCFPINGGAGGIECILPCGA
jgi:hypothetical protein